ncbi:TIGR03086 family protein [Streptomyces pactum]|uniref:TIGR03086 family protein n=1 Tax=Streptomyces pactum TaxID=68249 RepID=A0ABS0NQN7_9ACTN|nr:TIGR03086 family metal-binding protein [Streptomyces pactum]MBH5337530.1 TIGR03086 family protein [Streptomyces pactum]
MTDDDRTTTPEPGTPPGAPVDLSPAAARVAALLDGIPDDLLTAPTPCAAYPVAALLDHLMGLTLAFRHAAEKSTPPPAPGEAPAGPGLASADALDPRWRELLPRRLDELVDAWRDPAAWEGITEVGGVTLPAHRIGLFGLDELILHGWDLARATGQRYEPDPASVEAILALLTESASEEGTEGLFGPRVPVPAGAPPFERALGLSGRDPSWSAG